LEFDGEVVVLDWGSMCRFSCVKTSRSAMVVITWGASWPLM
jgi:hypothetical protein